MAYTPKTIRKQLQQCINAISDHPEMFSKNPGKDFTRTRKLPLKQVLRSVLSMSGKSIRGELMDYFGLTLSMPTVSAFIQQRNKIDHRAFEFLFRAFTDAVDEEILFNGYRLLAADGLDLHTPTNVNESDSFYQGANGQKPYNLVHINALYDLQRKIYTDAFVQGRRCENEHKALVTMVDRDKNTVPTIYILDRGYESYNNMAHIQEKGQKFIIRAKDFSYGGIVYALNLQKSEVMDENVVLHLTRKQTNHDKLNFKFLPDKCVFDYLPSRCKKKVPITPYDLSFRVVRFPLDNNSHEVLITNLDKNDFDINKLKQLYAMRWGIETSFRKLKYSLSLFYLHSKKTEYIFQEIFARLTMYNFAELVTSHVAVKHKTTKHSYQINFAATVHICRNFFLKNISPSMLEALMLMHLLPIRRGPATLRRKTPKATSSFNYRIP